MKSIALRRANNPLPLQRQLRLDLKEAKALLDGVVS